MTRAGRRRFALVLLAAFLLPVAPGVEAAPAVWTLDPGATQATFELGATLHTVEGHLEVVSGTLEFDLATGTASGEIVLDATATRTGNRGRDRKMHREVLLSERHPRIVFRVTVIEGTLADDRRGRVSIGGSVEIVGTRQVLEIEAVLEPGPAGGVVANAAFRIPYVAWGLEDPSTFLLRVDKHVDVRVRAVGSIAFGESEATDGSATTHDSKGGS